MKCPLLTARDYQNGFNAKLAFCGFYKTQKGSVIHWIGSNKEWEEFDNNK